MEDNERMRAEIRENGARVSQLCRLVKAEGSEEVRKRDVKKAMKLSQQRVKLVQKLGLRAAFLAAMMDFYFAATWARGLDISILENDPDIFKEEAWKYAKMFGDRYIHYYNQHFNK